jgi:hypothetical protein
MHLNLSISKQASALYVARMLYGNVQVTAPVAYSCVEDAIRSEAVAIPAGFAQLIDVEYAACTAAQ